MSDEMATFRVDVIVENPARPGPRRSVRSVLVDTGAGLLDSTLVRDLGVDYIRVFQQQ